MLGERATQPRFRDVAAFAPESGAYTLLPFRFARISGRQEILITTETGEFLFVPEGILTMLVDGSLPRQNPHYHDLVSKSVIVADGHNTTLRRLASQYRSRKSFLFDGPSLFLFVVTLRCDHSCHYCQVSRRSENASAFDMSEATALAAIDRVFEAPSNNITIEFQGGEPLLAFSLIQRIVAEVEQRAAETEKQISFSMTTTLHHATDEVLNFLKDHSISISTSLDGPAFLHDRHRPNPTRDSHARTMQALARARGVLGSDAVSALATVTSAALEHPEAIVDSYVEAGFSSIFLRPLSPIGFAARSERQVGYAMKEFVAFYARALQHVIDLNLSGRRITETYASLLLTHILTPFSTGYVDLRSPTGAGIGVLAFNYDGYVYPSDEARMLVEMGDTSLRLGDVHSPYATLMSSPALRQARSSGVETARVGGPIMLPERCHSIDHSGLWMQHCYQCGVGIVGDGFRREVQTGSTRWSSWSFSGRGRVGSGTRMGLRTVCEPCARSIDRWYFAFLIVKLAFWGGLIILFLRLCHTSEGDNQTAVPNALTTTSVERQTTPRTAGQATETPSARAQNRIGPSFNCAAPAVANQPLAQIICYSDDLARLELWPEVGDGVKWNRRRIVGVFEPPLLQRRSDTPCPTIASSS